MRAMLLLAAACCLAHAEDPREIVRHAVQLLDRNLDAVRNYAFLERSESREFEADARVKTQKISLHDVTMLEGSPYRRLVGRNDQPLSQAEEREEQRKLEESTSQRRNETPSQRAKRIADWVKRRQRERETVNEIPDAFDFHFAGEEQLDGRAAWVITATPKPGYRPRGTIARLFLKIRGKLWIDKSDGQWVKAQAEMTENLWWGLFVARIDKGSRIEIQMMRVTDEIWLPKRVVVKGSARIALFKALRIEIDTTYSNYRKL